MTEKFLNWFFFLFHEAYNLPFALNFRAYMFCGENEQLLLLRRSVDDII